MTSFWSLFILFVGFNIGFTVVSGAFVNSEAFDEIPDENLAVGIPFPSNLTPEFVNECNRDQPQVPNATTLISELCTKATSQELNITSIGATGEDQIVNTKDVGFFDWLDNISDLGQMIVFGATLLLNAITGDFIVAILSTVFVSDEGTLPAEFEIGVRVLIGLMWVALFYAMVFARSPTGQ